jgi:colanic acid/amylovoran biosynthesis glycosyltransferase
MKIAFFIREFPSLSETFIQNQIDGLIKKGHKVDIYTDNYQPLMPKNKILRILKVAGLFLTNIWTEPILLDSLNISKYGHQAANLRLFYSALRLKEKKYYDIIHCQFGTLGLVGLWLKQIGRLEGKLITSFRGIDMSKKYHSLYNELFKKGYLFLPNNQYFKNKLIELGCDKNKIIIHRSGINLNKFIFSPKTLKPNKKIKIVSIARLIEKKGIEYGIKAVAKLAKTNKNIEYNIIGDGPLRKQLQNLINESGLKNTIKILGWKKQDEIIEILKNSHILIAPSITGSDGDIEGIPNSLKEAMAVGLPVIGTFHSGIPELVKSEFLVPEKDSDALANKLNYLMQHPEIWPEITKTNRKIIEEQYDINKLNNQLIEIYNR